jgi:hypothetical protein
VASDQRRYWIKTLNNLQGPCVPITEQVVGRLGILVDAPTCAVATIMIPPDLAGWQFRPGVALQAGIAHACREVDPVVETGALERRAEDENARHHAYIYALHDWCWGGDGQWLVSIAEDNRYYSHDHGWYFPPNGPNWDVASLEANVDAPHELPGSVDGISATIARQVEMALLSVARPGIRNILATIPAAWPVSDEELETLGFFIERRASQAGTRLVARVGGGR